MRALLQDAFSALDSRLQRCFCTLNDCVAVCSDTKFTSKKKNRWQKIARKSFGGHATPRTPTDFPQTVCPQFPKFRRWAKILLQGLQPAACCLAGLLDKILGEEDDRLRLVGSCCFKEKIVIFVVCTNVIRRCRSFSLNVQSILSEYLILSVS